jgi:uncharacterized protein
MKYRGFGGIEDFEVSALGFGCMRLPTIGGDGNAVDEPLATRMLREAIDAGVNYVDTAHGYHGGNSERWLGRALGDGYREKVKVATKLPTWAIKEHADLDRTFNEQLERLKVEHIDVYLLHNLHSDVWRRMRDLGVLEWLDAKAAEGRVGIRGFSFHDTYDVFTGIVDAYDWQMCQLQYNYMNEDVQAGTAGLKYAADKGLAVVVMEPLLGGALAALPEPLAAADNAAAGLSPVEAALQWLWCKPEVATVLSGMSAPQHVRDNLEYADRSGIGELPEGVARRVADMCAALRKQDVIPCTRCGYCLPCPQGVDIPYNFQLLNDARIFGGNVKGLNTNLYGQLRETARAAACVQCRECEERCPQKIPIADELEKVKALFAPATPEGSGD